MRTTSAPIGAIDNDAQPVEAQALGERRLHEFDIAAFRIVKTPRAAELARGREALAHVDVALDLRLDLVGELVAVRPEQLDAVVVIGVVGGGDDDAQIGAQRAREHGHTRCGHRAQQHHVHADGDEARGQRRLQHVAGKARVLADDDEVPMGPAREMAASRHRDLERRFGGHGLLVGRPANPVGAE
jgi:hypothetical protein